MADKNTIKNWFRTNLKPTQAQFWALFDSYFHKDEKIPITAIDDIENILAEKADAEVLAHHLTNATAHADLFGAKEDKSKRGAALGYAPLNEFTKLAIDYLNVVNDLVTGGESFLLTAEQGKLLQTQINNINVLLASDNVNLDNVQELVDAIETVQTSLSTILVNNLTSGGTTKALTAEMGKTLKGLIDDLTTTVSNYILANTKTYKVYTALLNQTGSSAPAATILENTLGGTVLWSRATGGVYYATLTGAFKINKTAIFVTNRLSTDLLRSYRGDANIVYLESSNGDGNLLNHTFEIRVYN